LSVSNGKILKFKYDEEEWDETISKAQADAWAFKFYRESRKAMLDGIARNFDKTQFMDKLEVAYEDLIRADRSQVAFATSINTAYNQARYQEFMKAPSVEYLIYVAILDKRTTELCESLHDTIFTKEEAWAWIPPNHHLCRSLLSIYRMNKRERDGSMPVVTITSDEANEIEIIRKEDRLVGFKGIEKKIVLSPMALGAAFDKIGNVSPKRLSVIADRHVKRVAKVLPSMTGRLPKNERDEFLNRVNSSLILPVSLLNNTSNFIPTFFPRLSIQMKEELKDEEKETKIDFSELYNLYLDDVESYETLLSVLEERGIF